MTRTNDAVELPLTALVGTARTLLRLAIVTVSEPVMPDLANDGRERDLKSTAYSVELDDADDEDEAG